MNRSFYYLLVNQLNGVDLNIITCIINRLDSGKDRVRIQDVATENFVSPAYIIRLCKKLGFNGFSELVYTLAQDTVHSKTDSAFGLQQLIDNYDEGSVDAFVALLQENYRNKIYVVGEGFADIVSDYFVQRLAIYGFTAFNHVHLYDHVMLTERFPHKEQMEVHTLCDNTLSGYLKMMLFYSCRKFIFCVNKLYVDSYLYFQKRCENTIFRKSFFM